MLQQNQLFRTIGLGSFQGLTMRVTVNPAMLIYLNGLNSIKGSPNENYGREMMELFTLGHGSGYTETDVREQARALTGWTANYKNGAGWVDFHFKAENHDADMKVIFGKVGPFNWKNSVQLCCRHPAHPGYFVNRLWGSFIPVPPDAKTAVAAREPLRPLGLPDPPGRDGDPQASASPRGPADDRSHRSSTTPGSCASRGDRVETGDWVYLDAMAGQQLFYPPNVSGWDNTRWLDTSSFQARWLIARRALQKHALNPDHARPSERPPADPQKLVDLALGWWGTRCRSRPTRATPCSTTPARRWRRRSPTRIARRRSRS